MRANSLLSTLFVLSLFVLSQSQTTQDVANLQALVTKLNNTVNNLIYIASQPQLSYTSGGINYYNYMYKDAVVYQSIFDAYQRGIFTKVGTPAGWDETSYSGTKWYLRNILRIGTGVQNSGGILVNVPAGYNVLWVRVLNDRWETFRLLAANLADASTAIYACGNRGISEISPDGGEPDSYPLLHMWCPMPLYFSGQYYVYADANSDDWLSGIAFGKNLWNHAKNSAVAYFWNLNGGTVITWNSANWNTDSLAQLPPGRITDLYVPVIYSGKNKIIYIVEHNNNWVGIMHGAVTVNDQAVERFRTSYQNPFARHINGKLYNRYIATWFPPSVMASNYGAKFVKLQIDLSVADTSIFFREIGTHDYI